MMQTPTTSNGCDRIRCCRAHGHVDRCAHGLSVIVCSADRARCCADIHAADARAQLATITQYCVGVSQRSREDRRRQLRGRDRGEHRPARRSVREGRAQAARTRDAAARRSTAAERRGRLADRVARDLAGSRRWPGAHVRDEVVLHRLNRKEYANAVRDLLAVDFDADRGSAG